MKRRGFTLVEIATVVGIIGILLLIICPMVLNRQQKASERMSQSDLSTLRGALFAFQRDTGMTPVLLSDLWATAAPSNGINSAGSSTALDSTRWHGPYVDPQFSGVAGELLTTGTVTYTAATSSTPAKISEAATGNDSDGVSYGTY